MVSWLFDQVTWDGQALLVPGTTESGQVVCRVPRNTIHMLRLYSDAIGREIHLSGSRSPRSSPHFWLRSCRRPPTAKAWSYFLGKSAIDEKVRFGRGCRAFANLWRLRAFQQDTRRRAQGIGAAVSNRDPIHAYA